MNGKHIRHLHKQNIIDCKMGGKIQSIKQIKIKNGYDMAFIKIKSLNGIIKLTVFPQEFKQYKHLLQEGEWVISKIRHIAERITKEDIMTIAYYVIYERLSAIWY
ncbi:hypothetical protein MK805_11775 [Shimazuella sp. AN120528]|uniref:hypothetical protein n=1 Tax=Shimazuella soli TaxID=1892854 RepID=UPI001F1038F7|nr:hypothetical protein [Shimazuella soli]MCH5585623.1 hypothetical protein [Shimazuella soli]